MQSLLYSKAATSNREFIVICVRRCLIYKSSYRDLVEMMAERGVGLAHTTILRWVQRDVSESEKRWRASWSSLPHAERRKDHTQQVVDRSRAGQSVESVEGIVEIEENHFVRNAQRYRLAGFSQGSQGLLD